MFLILNLFCDASDFTALVGGRSVKVETDPCISQLIRQNTEYGNAEGPEQNTVYPCNIHKYGHSYGIPNYIFKYHH